MITGEDTLHRAPQFGPVESQHRSVIGNKIMAIAVRHQNNRT